MRIHVFAASLGLLGSALAQAPAPSDVKLVGDRFKPLVYSEMTPEQKTLVNNVLNGERHSLGGPYNVLLRSPEMGDLAQKFGAYVRFHSELPDKLRELVILMTARYWTAQFEWYAHHRAAVQAGLNPSIIEAIATGKRPASMQPDEEAVYNFCNEMLQKHEVSDATFRKAVSALGERRLVNLMGLMGYYHLVAILLDADRYPLPDGVKPELQPLR